MSNFFFNLPQSNPFSTRYTSPGKTPYFFDGSFRKRIGDYHKEKYEYFVNHALGLGEELRTSICMQFLVDQFETKGCRGQIVGRHGTGKSTLLAAMRKSLEQKGYEIFSWTLHDQQSFLPDVFWLELQRFLQLHPNLLPTRCLLPPPIVSRDDYLAQQRATVAQDLGVEDKEPVEEFRVPDRPGQEEVELSDWSASGSNALNDEPSSERPLGILGFNSRGNFGLLRSQEEAADAKIGPTDVKFDPFPGVAQGNETPTGDVDSDEDDEPYDDVRVEPSPAAPPSQPKLEIPLGGEFEYRKPGSFFDKKVVFFDGFEQLSYFNRIVVRTFCRMNHLGLLLTTHTPAIGVPVLFRTDPTVETLRQLLEFLLEYEPVPDDSELETLLKNFKYDVREILFSLYDAYERFRLAPRELREKIVRQYPR